MPAATTIRPPHGATPGDSGRHRLRRISLGLGGTAATLAWLWIAAPPL
ncbi:MAG: hypothetical protein WCO11_05050 [Sphingomonadales bacterium]